MPGGAKLFDKTTTMADSSLIGRPTWDEALGQGIAELFTNKIEAFYTPARPENGATCTLAHGDFRGDNIFFCTPTAAYPEGWLVIDFQLLFRGPVPSDLAYLMNSGSVLPSVYEGAGRETVLHAFYDRFMQRTKRYPDYTWDQFRDEFAMMSTVMFIYYVGMGAAFWQAGAFENARPLRVELGDAARPKRISPPTSYASGCGGRRPSATSERTSPLSISTPDSARYPTTKVRWARGPSSPLICADRVSSVAVRSLAHPPDLQAGVLRRFAQFHRRAGCHAGNEPRVTQYNTQVVNDRGQADDPSDAGVAGGGAIKSGSKLGAIGAIEEDRQGGKRR